MTTTIKYTATLDDNPFAAGTRRIGELLQGMQGRFSGVARSVNTATGAMSAQFGQFADSLKNGVTGSAGHLSGLLDAVGATRLGFVGLVAAAAGLAAGKAVGATAQMTEDTMVLARVLGTTTNVAQQWRLALDDVGATQGELEGAAKGLTRQLKENEADLQAMGLATRDAAGKLRPMNELLVEGLDIVNAHREGVDKGLAAQTIFGRGVDTSSKLLQINRDTLKDATAAADELGLQVGANAVAAWKDFDAASDRAAIGLKGMGNTVGSVLMPVVTDLINAFNFAMPTAIKVVRGALGGLASAFHLVKNGVVVVWEVVNAMVVTVAEPIRALGEAIGRALAGDFGGAADAVRNIGSVISGSWQQAMTSMTESSQRTRDRIAAIFGGDTADGVVSEGGGKGFVAPPDKAKKAKTKAEGAAPSFMAYYETALTEEKRLAAEQDATREYSKQQELAYWQNLLQNAQLVGNDRVAITRKTAELELQILRDGAKQQAALDDLARERGEQMALDGVELARIEARGRYEAGEISMAELLELEREHEQQRLEIKRTYLEARRALIDPERDPVAYAQISAQLEELERQHQQRMMQIGQEAAANARNNPMSRVFDEATASMQRSIEAMLQGQMTLKQGITQIWAGIRGAIVKEIAAIIARKVAGFAVERALAIAGITANSAQAASGAAASQASIPYVGPALAVAAMAAMLATVGGLTAKVPSAAGGWSIPSGVNPLTQLHEEEMVLSADIANPLRESIANGGFGGFGGGSRVVELRATPMPGNFFMVHRDALAGALREMHRDGSLSIGAS